MDTLPIPPQQARFAGLCYLIIILYGVGSEVALRGPLIDFGSAEETMQAISAESLRFRLSIMADVVTALADATLAVVLFLMFRPVSVRLALGHWSFGCCSRGSSPLVC